MGEEAWEHFGKDLNRAERERDREPIRRKSSGPVANRPKVQLARKPSIHPTRD